MLDKLVGSIFSKVASAGVSGLTSSIFGDPDKTPEIERLRLRNIPSQQGIQTVARGGGTPVENPVTAGSASSIAALIARHESIMDSITIDKGVIRTRSSSRLT